MKTAVTRPGAGRAGGGARSEAMGLFRIVGTPLLCLGVLLGSLLPQAPARAADEPPPPSDEKAQWVQVADPYLELHTGAGRGYPVFHVVERGQWVEILRRRTDWFQVRGIDGKVGWVELSQMELTLRPSGEETHFENVEVEEFYERDWEIGLMAGEFKGAPITTLYAGYAFNPLLSVEVSYSQALGRYAVNRLMNLNLLSHPFPEWRVSPFLTLGTGLVETDPRAPQVGEVRTDNTVHAGLGVEAYITRRFLFRAEYRNYVVFQDRDDNAQVESWQTGFAVFF